MASCTRVLSASFLECHGSPSLHAHQTYRSHSTSLPQFSSTASLPSPSYAIHRTSRRRKAQGRRLLRCRALQDTKETDSTAEEVTQKYGLEAGLWKIFSSKDKNEEGNSKKSKTDEAKELLAKYGGAYLATSISLSLVSFGLCYVLVSAGIDVQALLQKVGISAGETGEKVGTFALAYAAHKAASPIRFPPTVALTPIVAGWIGKNAKGEEKQ
ncbi:uncharacterized protein LOC116246059 [Nymphaea colorata]|nr:uncharacterized protein LOC116246059 [Nymphaea colorata]